MNDDLLKLARSQAAAVAEHNGVTAESLTDEQVLELRRETFARWNMGEFVPRAGEPGETLAEQLAIETAALCADGGHVGPPNYHARRVSQAEARAHCAAAINARRGAKP